MQASEEQRRNDWADTPDDDRKNNETHRLSVQRFLDNVAKYRRLHATNELYKLSLVRFWQTHKWHSRAMNLLHE